MAQGGPLRAVLFDFGGTLFRYGDMRSDFDRMLQELAARHGIRRPAEELRAAYRDAFGRALRDFADRPFYLHRELFAAAHHACLEAFGARPGPDEGELFYRRQTEVAVGGVRLREDVHETLRGLRARGLHLGVVSNIDEDQFRALWERVGLAPYVDATTTSEEARSCKPDPRIFHRALEKAGALGAEQALFVGDSPEQDVGGARALGMTTALIAERPGAPAPGPTPHHRLDALRDLLSIVGA